MSDRDFRKAYKKYKSKYRYLLKQLGGTGDSGSGQKERLPRSSTAMDRALAQQRSELEAEGDFTRERAHDLQDHGVLHRGHDEVPRQERLPRSSTAMERALAQQRSELEVEGDFMRERAGRGARSDKADAEREATWADAAQRDVLRGVADQERRRQRRRDVSQQLGSVFPPELASTIMDYDEDSLDEDVPYPRRAPHESTSEHLDTASDEMSQAISRQRDS